MLATLACVKPWVLQVTNKQTQLNRHCFTVKLPYHPLLTLTTRLALTTHSRLASCLPNVGIIGAKTPHPGLAPSRRTAFPSQHTFLKFLPYSGSSPSPSTLSLPPVTESSPTQAKALTPNHQEIPTHNNGVSSRKVKGERLKDTYATSFFVCSTPHLC